jgi:predicted ATPase
VIVLDDMQWADSCSLMAAANMATECDLDLFLVGIVDSNSVDNNNYDSLLAQKLREVQLKSHSKIVDIRLSNLNQ